MTITEEKYRRQQDLCCTCPPETDAHEPQCPLVIEVIAYGRQYQCAECGDSGYTRAVGYDNEILEPPCHCTKCAHCGRYWADHVNKKCLFSPATFRSSNPDVKEVWPPEGYVPPPPVKWEPPEEWTPTWTEEDLMT